LSLCLAAWLREGGRLFFFYLSLRAFTSLSGPESRCFTRLFLKLEACAFRATTFGRIFSFAGLSCLRFPDRFVSGVTWGPLVGGAGKGFLVPLIANLSITLLSVLFSHPGPQPLTFLLLTCLCQVYPPSRTLGYDSLQSPPFVQRPFPLVPTGSRPFFALLTVLFYHQDACFLFARAGYCFIVLRLPVRSFFCGCLTHPHKRGGFFPEIELCTLISPRVDSFFSSSRCRVVPFLLVPTRSDVIPISDFLGLSSPLLKHVHTLSHLNTPVTALCARSPFFPRL